MINDIEPRIFYNNFQPKKAQPGDLFLSYIEDTVLVKVEKEKLWYPSFSDYEQSHPQLINNARFLFSIDDINYFLTEEEGLDLADSWSYVSTSRFRTEIKYWRSFAGAVGLQLKRWYVDHQFCSRCGEMMFPSDKERMLYCKACSFQVYPKIAPCVIVGIHDGDRMLLTKYAGRDYKRFGLVAGFAEIGESLEQTVYREVKEEVGLKVKNLKFFKSQPWPFSDTLLAGFFAELEGDDPITLQEDELSQAVWVDRKDIPPEELKISLTGEMMEAFSNGTVKL